MIIVKKLVLISVFVLLLFLPAAIAPIGEDNRFNLADVAGDFTSPKTFEAPQGWYPVAQWEVDVCSYGLSTDVDREQGTVYGSNDQNLLFDDAATLQALKEWNYNEYIYQIGWFFQPLNGDVEYTVEVYSTSWEELVRETTNSKGSQGYSVWNTTANYTKARLSYDGNVLELNIVEK